METIDIQTEKLSLISWILQVQDISLLEKLKYFRQDIIEIPQWQKDAVMERIRKSDINPENLLNWDDVKDDFILD